MTQQELDKRIEELRKKAKEPIYPIFIEEFNAILELHEQLKFLSKTDQVIFLTNAFKTFSTK